LLSSTITRLIPNSPRMKKRAGNRDRKSERENLD
jgi:hypothetical protein